MRTRAQKNAGNAAERDKFYIKPPLFAHCEDPHCSCPVIADELFDWTVAGPCKTTSDKQTHFFILVMLSGFKEFVRQFFFFFS